MKNPLIIPDDYCSKLDLIETETAIKFVKDTFERELAAALNLTRVSAPLFLRPETGLNDNLNGIERPVQFDVPAIGSDVQIVQSLAKWKRLALQRYGFQPGSGLYTDMNAVRRDEEPDNLHSFYVDQWDWEKVITAEERNTETLQTAVNAIWGALRDTQQALVRRFTALTAFLPEHVTFVSSQALEDEYPTLTPHEREDRACEKYGAIFLTQIGAKLKSGAPHDGRAPDYDDWSLNGDLIVWYPVLGRGVELSSMGVRVDAASMASQLATAGCEDRRELEFHKMVLENRVPLTMGGGIGQSRICMMLLEKAHIGQVQASAWPEEMSEACAAHGVFLL